ADALHIPHLHYELIPAKVNVGGKIYTVWLTRSADFKKPGEHKLTFETYYEVNREPEEDIWSFIMRNQWEDYFYQVFLLDYLICNRDRHGANIEVLEKKGIYRLAPLFDNGLSLLFSCYHDGEAMEQFDRLKDGPVNNFVGSISLFENLRKVPEKMLAYAAGIPFDKKILFKGLEQMISESENAAVPEQYWNCIEAMVKERAKHIEEIFD
ncbi:MAG: hypothetical protein NC124_06250, partial [Clostridium sp.]|nr:hypothetical protein [Clostridium sp.]